MTRKFGKHSLMCDIDRWSSGRVSGSVFCGCWFDL